MKALAKYIIFFLLTSVATAHAEQKIYCDGNEADTPYILQYNQSYVSLRAVSDALGADIYWDERERCAKIHYDENETVIPLNAEAVVNGAKIGKIVSNDRIMLNTRDISAVFSENIHSELYDRNLYMTIDKSWETVKKSKLFTIGTIKSTLEYMTDFYKALARETVDALGIDLEVKEFDSADEALSCLDDGEVDAVWGNIEYDKREKDFLLFYPYTDAKLEGIYIYSYPYMSDGLVLMAENDCDIESASELKSAKIGCIEDDYDEIINVSEIKALPLDIAKYNTLTDLEQALDNGSINAFFCCKYQAFCEKQYKILPFLYDKTDYAAVFRKDDIMLRDMIDSKLGELRDSGAYDELSEKMLGTRHIGYFNLLNDDKCIYNGFTYTDCGNAANNCLKILSEKRIGEYNKISFSQIEYESGLFEAENSGGAVLRLHPIGSEYDTLFVRDDIKLSDFSAENISKIGYFPLFSSDEFEFNYYKQFGGYTTDKGLTEEICKAISGGERVYDAVLDSSADVVLLYTDALPSCAFKAFLSMSEQGYVLHFNNESIKISNDLADRIKGILT